MNGFHSFSSAAFFAKNPGRKLIMSLPDIYCTVISALQWRKNGNSITMLTDSAGAELFSALGINDIWNDIRIVIPDDLDGIDPCYVLGRRKADCFTAVSCTVRNDRYGFYRVGGSAV